MAAIVRDTIHSLPLVKSMNAPVSTGKKLTQRDFVLNLITQALDEADTENATEQNTPTEAPVAPRVADVTAPADTDTPHEDNAV